MAKNVTPQQLRDLGMDVIAEKIAKAEGQNWTLKGVRQLYKKRIRGLAPNAPDLPDMQFDDLPDSPKITKLSL